MLKWTLKNFFKKNGFKETHKNCFEKDKTAFVVEGGKLLACKIDENGYKIVRTFEIRNIKSAYRTDNGTAIF